MVQVAAVAVLLSMLLYILRASGGKNAAAVSLFGGVLFLSYALVRYKEPLAALREMAEKANLATEAGQLLRILAVCFLCGIAADACREMGEGTLASRVEFVGRAEILLLSLPFLLDIVAAAVEVWT